MPALPFLVEHDRAHDRDRGDEDGRDDRPDDLERRVAVHRRAVRPVPGLGAEVDHRVDQDRHDDGEDEEAMTGREPVDEVDAARLRGSPGCGSHGIEDRATQWRLRPPATPIRTSWSTSLRRTGRNPTRLSQTACGEPSNQRFALSQTSRVSLKARRPLRRGHRPRPRCERESSSMPPGHKRADRRGGARGGDPSPLPRGELAGPRTRARLARGHRRRTATPARSSRSRSRPRRCSASLDRRGALDGRAVRARRAGTSSSGSTAATRRAALAAARLDAGEEATRLVDAAYDRVLDTLLATSRRAA